MTFLNKKSFPINVFINFAKRERERKKERETISTYLIIRTFIILILILHDCSSILTVFVEFSKSGNRLLAAGIHPPRNNKYVLLPFQQDQPILYYQAIQRNLTVPMVDMEPMKYKNNINNNINNR